MLIPQIIKLVLKDFIIMAIIRTPCSLLISASDDKRSNVTACSFASRNRGWSSSPASLRTPRRGKPDGSRWPQCVLKKRLRWRDAGSLDWFPSKEMYGASGALSLRQWPTLGGGGVTVAATAATGLHL